MHLAMQQPLGEFERVPKRVWKTVERCVWEEVSAAAAALLSFVAELRAACPIPEETIQREIFEVW
eukprot:9378713-Lingulodinium_polyedra.AAC.1